MKVLIPVDESKIAEKAFEWYLQYMHRDENEVVVVHMALQPYIPLIAQGDVMTGRNEQISAILETAQVKVEKLKEKFVQKLKERGVKHKTFFQLYDGQPASGVVKVVQKEKVDCVVVGSRGMGKIRRTILGSVSNYILHHVSVPTVVCPV